LYIQNQKNFIFVRKAHYYYCFKLKSFYYILKLLLITISFAIQCQLKKCYLFGDNASIYQKGLAAMGDIFKSTWIIPLSFIPSLSV